MIRNHSNALLSESSPYLLQHAHNPVNWLPWSEDAFELAQRENKLVLISIGYSACHWCHVMERESFENEAVASIMNAHFICIKVDREEHPDVDQVYMSAVQLMTQRGGWPLNCFTLPDGRPLYGGTYFPTEQWVYILNSLEKTFREDPFRCEEYATKLHTGIAQSEVISFPEKNSSLSKEKLEDLVGNWRHRMDNTHGGSTQAPKFPLPSNYLFLLRYAVSTKDETLKQYVQLTLLKMAQGGIYDQIGGGFARYAVDTFWKVPHFEKMLYDNAQLLSLYTQAYLVFKFEDFRLVVKQTADWLEREMQCKDEAFYAAIDADSEGEEGKFYTWSEDELQVILEEQYVFYKAVVAVDETSFWEGKHIPLRSNTLEQVAEKLQLSFSDFEEKWNSVREKLLLQRSMRVRPGTDDKQLTSWNAMLISGLVDAYKAFQTPRYIELAIQIETWIESKQRKAGNSLFHTYKNGKATIGGLLEDYSFVISAYLDLYSVLQDEKYIFQAEGYLNYAQQYFQNADSKLFYFTPKDTKLIARKMEIQDNVTVSSNSQMAHNLFRLGKLLRKEQYVQEARQMLCNVYNGMENYGSAYSNWANLLMHFTSTYYEVVVAGKKADSALKMFNQHYLPHAFFVKAGEHSRLELVQNRSTTADLQIFICQENTCLPPVSSTEEALKILEKLY